MSYPAEFEELLCCPACQGVFLDGHCQRCGQTFEQTLGIWDLRWPRPDPMQPLNEHGRIEARILEQIIPGYEKVSYSQLVDVAMEAIRQTLGAPEQIVSSFAHYQHQPQARGNPMMAMFKERLSAYYQLPGAGLAVDVGCGVGAASFALAADFNLVVGIDPVLSNLLMAQKYCQELGIENAAFVQARSQRLPLINGCADYAVAQNVIEHLIEVEPAFEEIARVLRSEGCFCGDSRNRYDLFFAEPHVKLHLFGFAPRAMQPWLARKLRNLPYIGVRLLSLGELRRYARRAFGTSSQVTFPLASTYGVSTIWDERLAKVANTPLLGQFFLAVFPTHILVAQVD